MHTSPASSSGNPATSPLLRSPSRSGVPASGNSPAGRLSPASAARRWLWFGRRPSRSSSPVGLLLLLLLAVIAGAILIWLLATRDKSEVAAYVAMCLIVKDQPRDVVEWVHHHQRIGVGKFYVFDHNSSVPLVKELHPLIEAGAVRYQYFRNFTHKSGFPQSWVFDECLKHSVQHKFMVFVDTDEFVIVKGDQSLPQLLKPYEKFGALVPNVRIFGSSGHQTRPNSTINAYTRCAPLQHDENKHVKVIANTKFTLAAGPDPHTFLYTPGKFAVTERFVRVNGPKSEEVSEDKLAIYHYATRSKEEFQDKVDRGPAHGLLGKTWEFFKAIDKLSTETCLDAIRDPEARRKALGGQEQGAATGRAAVPPSSVQHELQQQGLGPSEALVTQPTEPQDGLTGSVPGPATSPASSKPSRRTLHRRVHARLRLGDKTRDVKEPDR